MAAVTAMVGYAASRGLDVKELCESVGLEAAMFGDPLQTVPFTLTRRLWCTVIERLPGENVGVGAGMFVRNEHIGYAGLLLSQAQTGLELVQLIVDAAPASDTALVEDPVILRHHEDQVEIRVPPILSAGIPERNEAMFLSMLSNLRRLGLPNLRPIAVHATHARTAKRAVAEQHYGCKVSYSAGEDAIWFSRQALSTPLPGSHPRAAEQLRALLAERAALSFLERARQVVRQQVQGGSVSQRAAASALGVSPRSLQRRLHRDGFSYADLAAQALESRAKELMRNDSYTLEHIALKLGYSDLRSFSRFWKRLTGENPAAYRSRLLSPNLEL